MLIPYEINGVLYHLTNEQIHTHIEKEEKMKKADREARLMQISKPELIKVVNEVASEARVDPKDLQSSKGGQEFIKKQDAKIKVHNREHLEKLKKARELRKKRIDQYRWTTTSRRKPETIIDILIHPNTKPVAITKKNKVVVELMTSVSKKYDRMKVNPREIGINPTLPAPEQISSPSSGRKRNEKELEPEFCIPGLECNRSLPEGAFQRISDIHKVDVDNFLSYLVMAANINTPKNQRFCVVMRSMIDSHPDKEKLKSNKVKLEAIGYSLN
nr:hypothetical protein [Tanacetum cinerariifolium]